MPTNHITGTGNPGGSFDTVVIGGGQAGLAAGYYLARQGANFIILDDTLRTGDAWRKRWESLRLFTPSKFNSLPGAPFPKPGDYCPTKDEVADYLEGYARQFNLPVRHAVKVESLSRDGMGYHLITGDARFSAKHVIIATGAHRIPYTPVFASQLDPSIQQLHSSAYCNPGQIQGRSVLVVGAGNSGAEIAIELAKAGKRVWLAGRDVGRLPSNGPLGNFLGGRPLWWLINHILTVNTPIGRKVKASAGHQGAPLGRATRQEVTGAGVELAPRVSGIESGKPKLENGRILPIDGVIWATGFRPDYSWIKLPIFDEYGSPRHSRGIVPDAPSLYFLGLIFQTGLSSSLLGGVGADAAYIAGQIFKNKPAA